MSLIYLLASSLKRLDTPPGTNNFFLHDMKRSDLYLYYFHLLVFAYTVLAHVWCWFQVCLLLFFMHVKGISVQLNRNIYLNTFHRLLSWPVISSAALIQRIGLYAQSNQTQGTWKAQMTLSSSSCLLSSWLNILCYHAIILDLDELGF